MRDPLAGLPEQARQRVVAANQPSWTNPMLATLTDRRFSDPGWVFEPKFDGERCLAFRKGPQVRLLSRNRKRLNDHYPELAEALAAQEADDFVVDGEVVAFQGRRSSFAPLQRRAASPACRRSARPWSRSRSHTRWPGACAAPTTRRSCRCRCLRPTRPASTWPPRVVCLGYQLKDGQLHGPRDMFDDPSFEPARRQCNQVMDYLRRHGPL